MQTVPSCRRVAEANRGLFFRFGADRLLYEEGIKKGAGEAKQCQSSRRGFVCCEKNVVQRTPALKGQALIIEPESFYVSPTGLELFPLQVIFQLGNFQPQSNTLLTSHTRIGIDSLKKMVERVRSIFQVN